MTPPDPIEEAVVVIGAGPSGLAVARQLKYGQHIDALVLDRAGAPAWSWRTRYDGFRLNTCGFWSHLPGQPIPLQHGRWPGREDMVAYFDDYVRRQGLRTRFGVTVERLERHRGRWLIHTGHESYCASAVLVATGNYHTPWTPQWPGRDEFTGRLLHSAECRNAAALHGCDVLVVGSGNSATDIALQLSNGVAQRVRMSVRTPPHLVPRAAAGIPVDAFSPLFTRLPAAVLDAAAAVMRRVWFGDLRAAGLPPPRLGIYTALLEEHRVPTLADELVPRIKDGRIQVVAAVREFSRDRVVLADGSQVRPDVVIAATGYRRGLEPLVGHLGVLDDSGVPVNNGVRCAAPGLWFLGYDEPLIGPLRALRQHAGPVAAEMAGYLGDQRRNAGTPNASSATSSST
ncbi:pyridine nucleotide-disulfide oxidoreductase [Mycolicibacterium duvalii]|uniref:Monooxygenase n=1 Tax=Mycolicibacterium duvalii TaxID=39688 RepID=A0A7I7K539_9MYCO|nr:NAD(P)/FAD-dependent oxidoreductase [Mycolicibacterium duvalii]MCV7368939.1 NAD(P)/FAD-dependent oxidoreductase [Mycolicibacterium duvalii]PEG44425.1 pyridine nucleotide-disulfide oxidoreductase [Mycolicibacterium duvalii]BBX19163.1 monooxygenase [Mycolicibacterium duvalii]